MDELRRERTQAMAGAEDGSLSGPRPYHRALKTESERDGPRLFRRIMRQRLLGLGMLS
jgi:hypothetical protein